MGKLRNTVRNIPVPCRVIFLVFPVAVLLHILFAVFPAFAEIYCRTVGAAFRSVLAWITNPFPVSVAEAMLIFSPFVVVCLIVYIIKTQGDDVVTVQIISALLSVATLVYTLFSFTFAAGFYVRDIGDFFGIERREITVDELYKAALRTAEDVNKAYSELEVKGPTYTVMGMSYDTMNGHLINSFDVLYDKYEYPVKLHSRVKPIVLSEPMTYTYVSGVYTFFTGEANINVNYPDFIIPYTAAHELSHQRGVSREDEANFVAFLVCTGSDDPYIRYSGYLNVFQYMVDAVGYVSDDMAKELYAKLDRGVLDELVSYSEFFDKYRDTAASQISESVNDAYLNVMSGTDSRSYGMVVDLVTLYYLGE